ncbi:MAG: DUF1553 domain-containing protein [Planctomycetaceae bacterium]|nr:DUF1553 domain-containing protein [Planctomycetaceae bacterium]
MRFLTIVLLLAACHSLNGLADDSVSFDRDIRPILSDKCFFCHGPDAEHREADLRLDLEAEAAAVIVAGDAEKSELVARILTDDAETVMPPTDSLKSLTSAERDLLVRWVNAGANWTEHWSFRSPVKPEVPQADESTADEGPESGPQHQPNISLPIDSFIARRLAADGKQLSDPSNREKLIRRVTYDLTGAPPTLEEVDAFVSDASADAFEKVVDRLLDSPRYGQRMALAWLDAARYGDTSVYHADGPRDMWAWRDAVVDAYNSNMPFDEFSICQLAGDLIPDATLQQRVLAGFNRNNGTTDEGGAFAEEYRVEYVVDRVKTTSTVWLGLTMECAQCHDHKYDPVSQEDYYRFYAFFNVSSDAGMQTRNGNAKPVLDIPNPAKEREMPIVQRQLDEVKSQLNRIESDCGPELQAWLKKLKSESESNPVKIEPGAISFPMVEGQGDQIVDAGSSAVSAKIQGKPNWVATRFDTGLKFDGSQFIDVGDVANFERNDSFSYGGWVKPQKKAAPGALIARMDDGNAYRGFDLFAGDGPISVHVIHQWPGNAIKVTTKKKLKPDQWQHVIATYDGSSKADGVKIFVDGEIWDWNIEQNGLTETIRTDKTLLIGSRHTGARLRGVVDSIDIFPRRLEANEIQQLAKGLPVNGLLSIPEGERTEAQRDSLRRYFLTTQHDEYQSLQQEVSDLEAKIQELNKPMTTVMVMGDQAKPRETFVLNRGAYDSPTDIKVDPATLPVLPPMSPDAPRNRLGLAKWLFQDDHPLTARVAVNRYWQMLFGVGLVSTPGDFGAQGEFPTHPELLDWLAVDFRDNGWNVKRLLKQIVMSQTYQQTSHAGADDYLADPENRWLARGPRFRLQGEFIRDMALDVSGLLVDRFGGPGVKPYQPPGLWAEVGLGGNPKFVQDHGDKLYRRSLYTYWKRSAPPPAMQIFDAPTREKCAIQRDRTNTPLQALVTLNDTQFVEAARQFAARMLTEGGTDRDQQIAYGFRLVTARRPEPGEIKVFTRILDSALAEYAADGESAKALLAVGESPRNESIPADRHAAWTMVAEAMLNLDETLTRE